MLTFEFCKYTLIMSTIIELHLITYFSIMLFTMLTIKMFLKTKANLGIVVFGSVMFAIIKFLLDLYQIDIIYQLIIIGLYITFTTVVIHKFDHISKLIISSFVVFLYYICLMGINWLISAVLNKDIYYVSNYYLLVILGLNFIIFSLFCLIIYYFKTENPIKLIRNCVLTISNIKIPLTGYIDTGNCLKDPKTNKCVVIVCINALNNFISTQMYSDLIFSKNNSGSFSNIKKLKIQTVSGENTITTFLPQNFEVDGKKIDCLVGITFNKMEYDVLINKWCM